MKHFLGRIRTLLVSLLRYEKCSRKLALSFSLGVYIAFSPFVGLHTVMAMLFSWIFALNLFILLAVSCFINNPWTMVPVYGAGHVAGNLLFWICNIDGMSLNPSWMSILNSTLHYYTGLSGISFWAFLLGGNLLGILFGVILYPIMRRLLMDLRVSA